MYISPHGEVANWEADLQIEPKEDIDGRSATALGRDQSRSPGIVVIGAERSAFIALPAL